ncbi:MAG: DUF523 domain-containing protein [Magnetococcus sp. MYC-9]
MSDDWEATRPSSGGEPVIRLGVSACLLGAEVRYDGGHKHNPLLSEAVEWGVQLVALCPEHGCGLGVPREPMHLEGDPDHPRLRTLYSGRDMTHLVEHWCRQHIAHGSAGLEGYLLKSRSPSCGLTQVPVGSGDGRPAQPGMGILPRLLRSARPNVPIAEGDLLQDGESLWRFLQAAGTRS